MKKLKILKMYIKQKKLVNFSNEMKLFDKKIKLFLNKNMYNNPVV